jgi:hypothetical protein
MAFGAGLPSGLSSRDETMLNDGPTADNNILRASVIEQPAEQK